MHVHTCLSTFFGFGHWVVVCAGRNIALFPIIYRINTITSI